MAYGKWIGAGLGIALGGGILGAIAGYALGSFFDDISEAGSSNGNRSDNGFNSNRQQYSRQQEERNGFLFSFMVLSAHIIQADEKIMHSEMEYVRGFLRLNFGEDAVREGEAILLRLFEYRKQHGKAIWDSQIRQACNEMRQFMAEEHRIQLLAFLANIAKADGTVAQTEIAALREVASLLGMSPNDIDRMLALGGNILDDAYKVLGVSPEATDKEVRNAYLSLVRKHHPDRVATLGDDVKEAAKKKMQEINDAKERVYKARGM